MAYLAPNPELRVHQADIRATEEATTLALDPARMASLSPGGRQAFDQAFIRVLVRRLHAAKTAHYVSAVAAGSVALRPGVRRLLHEARAADLDTL